MAKKIDEKNIHKLLSKNLRRIRMIQNISQLDLALRCGLTHNFINDIENCKKGVSAKTLAKLSNVLKVEPYQFYLPENPPSDIMLYVRDFNDSLQKMVAELEEHYGKSSISQI